MTKQYREMKEFELLSLLLTLGFLTPVEV